ncbi:MAG: hypothetical protein ACE5RO_06535, partial [Candidatus Nitrosomaritimum yanchengensis]
GDYFDDFNETFELTNSTAKWLTSSVQKENRMHLIGNHDLNYINHNPKIKCSGYTYSKYEIIKQYNIQWDKMRLFCWVDDWLCTHAGFSFNLYKELTDTCSVSDVIEL